ncbi:MAG: acyl-[acyl-carrier-protein] thioesterase, partial [Lachnospiraceae bacterium]
GIFGYRNFTIRDKNGEYLVKANSHWFFFDTEKGTPTKRDRRDIRGYGVGSEEKLDMEYAPRRIKIPEEHQEAEPVVVARHHIDTNHHVNNAQYVEIAENCFRKRFRSREIRVEYQKSAVLGDVIYPRISKDGEATTIALCNREGAPYAVVWFRCISR